MLVQLRDENGMTLFDVEHDAEGSPTALMHDDTLYVWDQRSGQYRKTEVVSAKTITKWSVPRGETEPEPDEPKSKKDDDKK